MKKIIPTIKEFLVLVGLAILGAIGFVAIILISYKMLGWVISKGL